MNIDKKIFDHVKEIRASKPYHDSYSKPKRNSRKKTHSTGKI